MASVDQPGLWSFATLQMPAEPSGSYQTVGLLLKIAGWVRLAQLGLAVLVGAVVLMMLAFMGAVGGAMMPSFGPWGLPAGAVGGLFLLLAVVAVLVMVAVAFAMTYWTSWIYARWVDKDPRALQHVFVYGIVTIVLSGLGALGGLTGNPTSLIDIALLVIGILLLIESRKPEHGSFGSPTGRRPEQWRQLD